MNPIARHWLESVAQREPDKQGCCDLPLSGGSADVLFSGNQIKWPAHNGRLGGTFEGCISRRLTQGDEWGSYGFYTPYNCFSCKETNFKQNNQLMLLPFPKKKVASQGLWYDLLLTNYNPMNMNVSSVAGWRTLFSSGSRPADNTAPGYKLPTACLYYTD